MRKQKRSSRIGITLMFASAAAAAVFSYLYSGEIYGAYLRFYFETVRGKTPDTLFEEATALYKQKQYLVLIERLDTAVAAYPQRRDLRSLRGLTLITLGKKAEGTDEVLLAAEDGPLSRTELEATIPALFDLGRFRDIVAVFRTTEPGNDPELLSYYGISLYRVGRYREAATRLRAAVDAGAADYRTYLFLGQSFDRAGNPRGALPFLQRARAINPADPAATKALASAYRRLGMQEEAARLLRSLPE